MDPFNNPYIQYVLRRDWWITHHSMEFYEHWKQRMDIYNKLANMIKKTSPVHVRRVTSYGIPFTMFSATRSVIE